MMPQKPAQQESLPNSVERCLKKYFTELDGMSPPPNLHEKIVAQVEKPLIEQVLGYVRGNQLKAAEILGINRNTLRKKIITLGIDPRELKK